jgi:hypothetical protein
VTPVSRLGFMIFFIRRLTRTFFPIISVVAKKSVKKFRDKDRINA